MVLARFSKNYLPILFNLYTGSSEVEEGDRLPLLQCVQAYITITDQTLVTTFFNKIVEKIAEKDLEKRSRCKLPQEPLSSGTTFSSLPLS